MNNKQMTTYHEQNNGVALVNLTHEERSYLAGIIKEHLEYYRLLCGHPRASQKNKDWYTFCKALSAKLSI